MSLDDGSISSVVYSMPVSATQHPHMIIQTTALTIFDTDTDFSRLSLPCDVEVLSESTTSPWLSACILFTGFDEREQVKTLLMSTMYNTRMRLWVRLRVNLIDDSKLHSVSKFHESMKWALKVYEILMIMGTLETSLSSVTCNSFRFPFRGKPNLLKGFTCTTSFTVTKASH